MKGKEKKERKGGAEMLGRKEKEKKWVLRSLNLQWKDCLNIYAKKFTIAYKNNYYKNI